MMQQLQDALIIALNLAVMSAAGMTVRLEQVRTTLHSRQLVAITLLINFLVLPGLAWGGAAVLQVAPAVALGILLAAVAPGGGTGLLLTRLAGGNVSVAVAMLFLFIVAGAIAAPLIVSLLGTTANLRLMGGMMGNALLYQLLPLGAGLLLQTQRPGLGARLEPVLNRLGLILLLVLVLGLLVTKGHLVVTNGIGAALVMVACVAASLFTGLLLRHEKREDRAAFALSTAVRNLSLALLLASLYFDDPATMLANLTYGLVMYFGAGVAVALYRRVPRDRVGLTRYAE